jgi:disulfide bond formation protein DsbB
MIPCDVTRDVTVLLAALGLVGQVLLVCVGLVAVLAVLGLGGPLATLRRTLAGYELWLVFAVTAVATGGSLFFSEVAHYVPCELCWYQRICMYPLSITTLLMALANDYRAARYLLPLPIVGAGVSVYHLLVENGVASQSSSCLISAPGGCGVKWIDEFGYMTIPTLALTAFALAVVLLLFAVSEPDGYA